MQFTEQVIGGWGHFPKTRSKIYQPQSVSDVCMLVKELPQVLPRGNGRSYGDSSLFPVVIDMTSLNRVLGEMPDCIEVEAGITLEALLKHISPLKKFLPVTPGIKSVTIGGAIASDVHGKNHLHKGSFMNITRSLQLVNSEGNVLSCSREINPDLFFKAFGGMGTGGIIVSACIELFEIDTIWIREEKRVFSSFEALYQQMELQRPAEYLVAWIDLLCKDFQAVLVTGSWVSQAELLRISLPLGQVNSRKTAVPFRWPIAPHSLFFKILNHRYLIKARKTPVRILHFDSFFYPLDSVRHWNRIYGRRGMLQYHFVLPLKNCPAGLDGVIGMVRASRAVCTLAVLKIFGKTNPQTPWSFPLEGYNLALDFIRNRHSMHLIQLLDKEVARLGGRVYKTKDALSSVPTTFETHKFNSNQNIRYANKPA